MLAKAFQTGGSTAIRIPKTFNVQKNDEFVVKKVGTSIVLT